MKAFIERIDDSLATLLVGEDETVTIHLPAAWLPAGSREGMSLSLTLSPAPAETAADHATIADLYDELGNAP
jgi:hypothetical protein